MSKYIKLSNPIPTNNVNGPQVNNKTTPDIHKVTDSQSAAHLFADNFLHDIDMPKVKKNICILQVFTKLQITCIHKCG